MILQKRGTFIIVCLYYLITLTSNIIVKSNTVISRPLTCSKIPLLPECIEFIPDPQPTMYIAPEPLDLNNNISKTYWEDRLVADGTDIPKEDEPNFAFETPKIYRYFEGNDISGVEDKYLDSGFKTYEWPGKITRRVDYDAEEHKTHESFQDYVSKMFSHGKNVVPLTFEKDVSRFLNYPCNLLQGLQISVVTYRKSQEVAADYNPIYMSLGELSLHEDYVHPLMIETEVLNKMVEDHTDPSCTSIEDSQFVPKESKINFVYDMAFTNDRLILGMHCGILILKIGDIDLLKESFAILAPTHSPNEETEEEEYMHESYDLLMSPLDSVRQQFEPISLLSASTCCSEESHRCEKENSLVVAYSLIPNVTRPDQLKFVYVSTDYGTTFRRKILATAEYSTLNLIRKMYMATAKHLNDKSIREPFWLSEEIAKVKALGGHIWVDQDPVVDYILSGNTNPLAYTINITRHTCAEIVSLQVIPEKSSFIGLCRISSTFKNDVDYDLPVPTKLDDTIQRTFAVFEFKIDLSNPIITPKRKSQRRLSCNMKAVQGAPDPANPSGNITYSYYEPDIIRVPSTFNIFVVGCRNVIYHSVNGGRTFWNVVFYLKPDKDDSKVFRHFKHPDLDYALMAFSPTGETVTLAFDNKYGYGLINYNYEMRMVIGKIAKTEGRITDKGKKNGAKCFNSALEISTNCTELKSVCELQNGTRPKVFNLTDECAPYWRTTTLFNSPTKFIPLFSNSGKPYFAYNVIGSLKLDESDHSLSTHLKGRDAIRFVEFPFQLNRDFRPLFKENKNIKDNKKSSAFSKCHTYSFSMFPNKLTLDVGEKSTVRVRVEDVSVAVNLGIYTSVNKLLDVNVKLTNRTFGVKNEDTKSDWDVTFKAIGTPRNRIDVFTGAFFGDRYNLHVEESSHVIISSVPYARCHTQPIGNVHVDLGCGNKVLVAHEDYFRPHCQKYFNNYKFTLKPGEFDVDMVDFWIKNAPHYYKKQSDGSVEVTYPYELFDCPVRPYRMDNYVPDLRIIDLDEMSNITDTKLGLPYNRSYVLIEIHGRKKFTYSKTVRDAGCVRPPQRVENQIKHWKKRLNVVKQGFANYPDFDLKSVHHPRNIWNQAIYRPCDVKGDFNGQLSEKLLDSPYEIMRREEDDSKQNELVFHKKDFHELYIFLAVEVDPSNSYCEFTRFFAISVRGNLESSDFWSFFRFLMFFVTAILSIVLCFFAFRYKVRYEYREYALIQRLEKAAWQVLYRYESVLSNMELAARNSNESIRSAAQMKRTGSTFSYKIRSKHFRSRQSASSIATRKMSMMSFKGGIHSSKL